MNNPGCLFGSSSSRIANSSPLHLIFTTEPVRSLRKGEIGREFIPVLIIFEPNFPYRSYRYIVLIVETVNVGPDVTPAR